MPTLVVASEEEEGGRVVDLQGPQIEHTLQMQTEKSKSPKLTTYTSNALIYDIVITIALILSILQFMYIIPYNSNNKNKGHKL